MATNTLHSIPHNHHSLLKRNHHSSDTTPFLSSKSFSLFLKPTTTTTTAPITTTIKPTSLSSSTLTFSLSANTITTSSSSISLDLLRIHLSAGDFRQADEVTRRLLIALAGDAAVKRGYVFFSEVQYISETDLKAIDELWRSFSDGKFGYSVQKRIFNRVNNDFTRFFIKVGWMKKLDTEVVQYNYRSFPTEFMWGNDDDTPEGHLPLTNALRGTQLLNSILSHSAFNDVVEDDEYDGQEKVVEGGIVGGGSMKGLRGKLDYSF